MSTPHFAVVGHPNKGKSSLVATLARDPSVRIGPLPGLTRETRRFPMQVKGQTLYTLADTPGFQRARAALAWMRQHEGDAASRPAVVARFVAEMASDPRFQDECELLRPIIEGAGLIYVVDGAAPYGPEYEAEMEILRWTGRPSMAVINPIGEPRFVEPWKNALGQFFRIVRVMDVLQAPFPQQIELLRAFGQLVDEWRTPLNHAIEALEQQREQQRADAARSVAELLADALQLSETQNLPDATYPRKHAPALEEKYRRRLRQLERGARSAVEAIYGHEDLDRTESDLELLTQDLLAEETWLAFGLKPRDLIALGAASGAVAGGVVDASLLGASLLAGTLVGGLVGGTLGYVSGNKLADVKILRQPLGGTRLRCGPTKNVQFPFVLLGRARLHHALIAARTHARRDALILDRHLAGQALEDTIKRGLARHFDSLRRSDPGSTRHSETLDELTEALQELFRNDENNTAHA